MPIGHHSLQRWSLEMQYASAFMLGMKKMFSAALYQMQSCILLLLLFMIDEAARQILNIYSTEMFLMIQSLKA